MVVKSPTMRIKPLLVVALRSIVIARTVLSVTGLKVMSVAPSAPKRATPACDTPLT